METCHINDGVVADVNGVEAGKEGKVGLELEAVGLVGLNGVHASPWGVDAYSTGEEEVSPEELDLCHNIKINNTSVLKIVVGLHCCEHIFSVANTLSWSTKIF